MWGILNKAVSGRKRNATAAPDDLFKVDEDAMKLYQARAKASHNITAKGIYVAKRARPDISLSIAFLTTRVNSLSAKSVLVGEKLVATYSIST